MMVKMVAKKIVKMFDEYVTTCTILTQITSVTDRIDIACARLHAIRLRSKILIWSVTRDILVQIATHFPSLTWPRWRLSITMADNNLH